VQRLQNPKIPTGRIETKLPDRNKLRGAVGGAVGREEGQAGRVELHGKSMWQQ